MWIFAFIVISMVHSYSVSFCRQDKAVLFVMTRCFSLHTYIVSILSWGKNADLWAMAIKFSVWVRNLFQFFFYFSLQNVYSKLLISAKEYEIQ